MNNKRMLTTALIIHTFISHVFDTFVTFWARTMNKDVDFNGRLRMRVVLNTSLLKKSDPDIAVKKREALEAIQQLAVVPSIDSDIDLPVANGKIKELANYVSFEPFLTGNETKVVLFHILVTSRRDNIYTYFLRPPVPPLSKELYLPNGVWNETYRAAQITLIQNALNQWKNLTTLDLLNKEAFSLLVKRKTMFLNLRIVRWAPYVNHCLFKASNSRLLGFDALGRRERFLFTVIDPSDDKHDWPTKVAHYRKDNPLPPTQAEATLLSESGTSLPNLPYDERLLQDQYISMAVLDTQAGNTMVGYVTCSVKAMGAPKSKQQFKCDALNAFRGRLEKDQRVDCGYDEFSIDGLHVSKNLGVTGVAKALFYYAIEFIRNAHETLGVTLLSAGSEAAATKAILTRFGYTHYNRVNTLKWLVMAFEDYYTQESDKYPLDMVVSYVKHGTPETLLTLERLIKELNQFHSTYLLDPYGPQDIVGRIRNKIVLFGAQYKQYMETMASLEDETAFDNANIKLLEALPSTIAKLRAYGAEIDPPGPDGSILTRGYMADVRRFLGTGFDDHDTFLYIGNVEGQQRMNASTQPFLEEYLKGSLGRLSSDDGELDGRQVSVVKSAGEESLLIMDEEDERYEPEVEDLTLYDHWLSLDPVKRKRQHVEDPLSPQGRLVINLMSESEEEEEQARKCLLSEKDHLTQEILFHQNELLRLRAQLEENGRRMQQLGK